MKPRTLALVAALVAVPTAAAVVPGRLDGATVPIRTRQRATAVRGTVVRGTVVRGTVVRGTAPRGTATLVSVKVTTAVDNPAPAQRDALREPGRRVRGAGCTNPGPGGSGYTLTGTRVNGPTTEHLNPAGGPGAAASAFQAAFNTWMAADPNAPSISVVSDSSVTSPRADGAYELMFAPLGGRTLGITYTWHWSTGQFESDTVFSTNVPWFIASSEGDGCYEGVAAYDLQNTATHEFGHVYGLGHTTSTFNTMYPSATMGETWKRSLAPGDAAGIQAIY